MGRVLIFIGYVDGGSVLAVAWVRRLLIDWLGCTKRWFELPFIGAYAALMYIAWRDDLRSVWWLLFLSLAVVSMWADHKTGDQRRWFRLFSVPLTVIRACMVLWAVFWLTVALIAWPGLRAMAGLAGFMVYMVFQYVTCLPWGDGERGKKAKLAAAKLKELFGTGWQTEPLPRPV